MKRLLVLGATLALAAAGGGQAAQRIDCVSEARYVQPSLSADGRIVAYVLDKRAGCDVHGPLFVSLTRGGTRPVDRVTPHELTAAGDEADAPLVAPNGTRVAFSVPGADKASYETLETLRIDGADLNVVGPGTSPSFAPDGIRLAYAAPDRLIHIVEEDGFDHAVADGDAVTWSPDGSRLAVLGYGGGIDLTTPAAAFFHVLSPDTFTPPIVWSADSTHLAAYDKTSGSVVVFGLPDESQRLVNDVRPDNRPLALSPDGGLLYLLHGPVVNVVQRTRYKPFPSEDVLAVSLDSRRVIVGEPSGGVSVYKGQDLYSVDRSGKDPRLVVPNRCAGAEPPACWDGTDGRDLARTIHTVYGHAGADRLLGVVHGEGAFGNDTIVGTARNDVLEGQQGNDRITGGRGIDEIDAGPGNDVVYALDGRQDSVVCGPGRDVAFVDRFDRVAGCERLHYTRR